jgi:LysM repeat protein
MTRSAIRWLVLVLVTLPLLMGMVGTAAAQCIIRNDWPSYIVQRGDTVARIARAYGTDVNTLVAANCLANPNRIFSGQIIRVPPAPVVITPPPSTGSFRDAQVSFQQFERGFMIWVARSGEITVYYNNGTVQNFFASSYASLPDNPGPNPAPAGFVRPIFALGKVWGNYANVWQSVGWGTTAEQGYTMRIFSQRGAFQFTLPDGRTVYVTGRAGNQTWSFSSSLPTVLPPVPTAPPPTAGPSQTITSAAYQPYEGGFMIWEANTGNVVAFYNNGLYGLYPASRYSGLPDNPVLDPTPIGRVRPAFALGKVWGNFSEVRTQLGWAVASESSFTATFTSWSSGGQPYTCFSVPGYATITFSRLANGTTFWYTTGGC